MMRERRLVWPGIILTKLVLALFMALCIWTVTAVAAKQTLRVGVYENEPKIFTDKAGKAAGIYVDLLEHIAAQEGWQLEYVPGSWGECLDRLAANQIDLMPDVGYTAERARLFSFHKIPALSSWFQVYAPKESGIKSILDLNDRRLLVLDRSIQQEAFVQLSKGFGLHTTIISVPDYKTMFEMVKGGKADAAITNSYYGLRHARKYGLEDTAVIFEPSDLFFAAAKGDPKHLLAVIDRYLDELKKDPQSIYYRSIKHWTSEEVRFRLPAWLRFLAVGSIGFLLVSLLINGLLKYQVNLRTRDLQLENEKRQAAQQRFMDIIEFLPDATFVIDQRGRVIAWNQACEHLSGVKKEAMLGQGDYAYAEPFFGTRQPILIDVLDQPLERIGATYSNVLRKGDKLYAESCLPLVRAGRRVHLWGVASPLYDGHGQRCGAIETVRDITEQKETEQALRKSEREYRELVMLANSIIMRWSPDGRIIFLNEFGQRFFGYAAEDIVGRHVVGTIVPETESQGRDLQTLIQEICADPVRFERNINENVRRNGQRVWVDWTNKIVFDDKGEVKEILSIGSDITERRRAEEQIRLLNDELRRHADSLEQRVAERTAELLALNEEQRAVFESASTGIVLLQNRTIVRCNRKLEEIAGYDPGELIGRSTRIWYPDDAAFEEGGKLVYAQLANGQTFCREQQMPRKDGSLFWVRLRLQTIISKDPLQGAVGIVEDITAEREAAEQLRKALEAAQAADRLKSAFLATMSHELRTPLNSIIGFTGIMLQGLAGPLNEEQHKQMTMVQDSSRHLLALINDVLDISKIEAGQLVLAPSSFDLRASVEKMANLVRPQAEKRGIELRRELPEQPVMMHTDQRRLEQIILNLLNNGVKFTDRGRVTISCRLEADHVVLSFTDTGIGMREEELPTLFRPFRQLDTGTARKREGTGLGLSICKKIVDLMGGVIEVESEKGRGSTFVVRLPRQRGDAA